MEPDRGSVERMATPEAIEEARRVADLYYEELLNDARLQSRDGIASVADVVQASRLARIGRPANPLDDPQGERKTRWVASSGRVAVYLLVFSGALVVAAIIAAFVEGEAFAARFGGLSSVVVALSAVIGILSALPIWLRGRRHNQNVRKTEDSLHVIEGQELEGWNALRQEPSEARRRAANQGKFFLLWLDIEKGLREAAIRGGVGTEAHVSSLPNGEVLQELRQSGLISEVQDQDIRSVLSVRNRMVHGRDLSDRDVRVAIKLANSILAGLG